jgi:hypothetical protein
MSHLDTDLQLKRIDLQQNHRYLSFRKKLALRNKFVFDFFYYFYILLKIAFYPSAKFSNNRSFVITDIDINEGIGAQLLRWCNAKLVSTEYNLAFVHTALRDNELGKGYNVFLGFDELDDLSFKKLGTDTYSLVVKLPLIDQRSHKYIQKLLISWAISKFRKNNTLFILHRYSYMLGHYNLMHALKSYYFSDFKGNRFDKKHYNIAVHIRRPNIHEKIITEANQYRFLKIDYFINAIKSIQKSIDIKKSILIHVYSEGAISQYAEMSVFENVIYHLNEDLFETFNDFVHADALILSPGAFSYYAGIISEGKKYTQNNLRKGFLEFPLTDSSWYELDENGFLLDGSKKCA